MASYVSCSCAAFWSYRYARNLLFLRWCGLGQVWSSGTLGSALVSESAWETLFDIYCLACIGRGLAAPWLGYQRRMSTLSSQHLPAPTSNTASSFLWLCTKISLELKAPPAAPCPILSSVSTHFAHLHHHPHWSATIRTSTHQTIVAKSAPSAPAWHKLSWPWKLATWPSVISRTCQSV